MKFLGLILVLLVAGISTTANAQAPVDYRLELYQQLLSEANDRLVAAMAENRRLGKELVEAKKPAAAPTPPPVPRMLEPPKP